MAIVKNNLVIPITLHYKIGIVTSVSYGNGIYVVALRVPFENATGSFNYGSVLLSGTSLSSLHLIYQKSFISIESVDIINNEIVASGYEQSGNNYLGILLILKT